MESVIELELNGQQEIFTLGRMARQSNGAITLKVGNTVMLATVVYEEDVTVEEDFLPLTVQYIEKSYAAGKFPGGFVKREAKPGDFETLTSRIIDRSLRPLFPKSYRHPTQITILVLSCDDNADLQRIALNAASCALYISDLPIEQLVSAVRISKQSDQLIINPTHTQITEGQLDLFVTGSYSDLLMIEMRTQMSDADVTPCPPAEGMLEGMIPPGAVQKSANELSENDLMEALKTAQSSILDICQTYEKSLEGFKKAKQPLQTEIAAADPAIVTFLEQNHRDTITQAVKKMAKSERHSELKTIARTVAESETQWEYGAIYAAIQVVKRSIVRTMILNDKTRADGRGLTDVRPIDIETNLLPNVHGSTLFTRGETQALVVTTLGGDMDAQMYELLNAKGTTKERFMVHYNFPGFSVGEASPVGPPGRRELGHGNLAKRALEPAMLETGKTVRLVSEILESNGSSSMATVCGGSLALKAAGIPVTSLIAGVAMGLVIEGERYGILTDIMGLEDHDGDLDFKIAGSRQGITAMQMDMKLGGLDLKILEEALLQAKAAREHILGIMEEAAETIVINDSILPSTETFFVNPGKIVDIIGQAGKTIKEIIERFDVAIDLDKNSGEVRVSGASKGKVTAASDHIRTITNRENGSQSFDVMYKEGEVLKGVVKKIVDFGAFIELPKGNDGLLHISKLSTARVEKVEDVLDLGQEIEVKVLAVNKKRIELGLVY